MKPILIALVALVLAGCVQSARLYNLDSGEVLTAKYTSSGTGHGKITLTTKDGKVLEGEYTTISGSQITSGFGSANVMGNGGYAWATGQGFSVTTGRQYGSAICTGHGLVIEIVYEVDPWTGHGHGVGKDNKGGRYNLQF